MRIMVALDDAESAAMIWSSLTGKVEIVFGTVGRKMINGDVRSSFTGGRKTLKRMPLSIMYFYITCKSHDLMLVHTSKVSRH